MVGSLAQVRRKGLPATTSFQSVFRKHESAAKARQAEASHGTRDDDQARISLSWAVRPAVGGQERSVGGTEPQKLVQV